MSLDKIKQLREERAKLVADAQAILKQGKMSAEDEKKFDAIMADVDAKKVELDRFERVLNVERELSQRVEQRAGIMQISPDQIREDDERSGQAFDAYMRRGILGLSDDERALIQRRQMAFSPEIRAALGVGTGAGGAFTVPQGFSNQIEDAEKEFGAMLEDNGQTFFDTGSGNAIPWPTDNDTGNTGEQLGENTGTAEQDVTFGSVTFDSYMYSSKLVRVSFQLLEDSAFDLNRFLSRKLGERIGRIVNQRLTTGTGTAQPNGIVTAAALGKTGTAGQTTSVVYNDLVDLEHSIDPAYRKRARWMMADNSLKVIKKMVDGQSRPLWMPGIAVGAPDTILGYRYVINQDVPVMAASAKSILFGAVEKYVVRRVRQIGLLRLQERYAEALQVGFIAYQRFDGDLLDAGTNPVKYYANSAT